MTSGYVVRHFTSWAIPLVRTHCHELLRGIFHHSLWAVVLSILKLSWTFQGKNAHFTNQQQRPFLRKRRQKYCKITKICRVELEFIEHVHVHIRVVLDLCKHKFEKNFFQKSNVFHFFYFNRTHKILTLIDRGHIRITHCSLATLADNSY